MMGRKPYRNELEALLGYKNFSCLTLAIGKVYDSQKEQQQLVVTYRRYKFSPLSTHNWVVDSQ